MGTTNNSGYILKGFYYYSLAIHGHDTNIIVLYYMIYAKNVLLHLIAIQIMMVVHIVRS